MEHFQYGKAVKTTTLRLNLEKLRGAQCENCKLTKWLDKDIPLEVHHLDGDHLNNDVSNLQLLCPNCHAQTENWRGRNINTVKSTDKNMVTDEQFVEALQNHSSIRQALIALGLTGAGGNYERAYRLIGLHNIKHLQK